MNKIKVYQTGPLSYTITLPFTRTFHNTLRRILLTEIKSLSIDLITIYHNTSNMPNEMLCHRIGMIPLPYLELQECNCENFCSLCSVKFKLNVSSKDQFRKVFASDFECSQLDVSSLNSLILNLCPRQSIKLKGIAKNGRPRDHAKFCAVNTVCFDKNGLKVETERDVFDLLEDSLVILKNKLRKLSDSLDELD